MANNEEGALVMGEGMEERQRLKLDHVPRPGVTADTRCGGNDVCDSRPRPRTPPRPARRAPPGLPRPKEGLS